ncbi:hypothetical protein CDO73_12495 [Saccharibacillus sp. O23]|uniref:hypothetical protein n=1 Tax=Saccharibacillus sp. O23 TaxID=2009338 RepID=UPI000B4E6A6E|nr:hypothetical protein [Saccharibacillus sp. O23]OWR29897.1 hypothetical protein CDO73_12495 [Saccharibacillus sp. O23]
MSLHRMEFNRQSLIGSLTAEVPPLLRMKSGDTLRFNTPDAGWGVGESWATRVKPVARETVYDGGHGPSRVEAIALGSAVVDLRITQIVNGVKGVHALLPQGAFR